MRNCGRRTRTGRQRCKFLRSIDKIYNTMAAIASIEISDCALLLYAGIMPTTLENWRSHHIRRNRFVELCPKSLLVRAAFSQADALEDIVQNVI